MRKKILIIPILLILTIGVFLCFGFLTKGDPPEAAPPPNPIEIYRSAVSKLPVNKSFSYRVHTSKETVIGKEVLTDESNQTISILYSNGSFSVAQADITLSPGNSSLHTIETFKEGKLYISIDDNAFVAPFRTEDIFQRYAPVQLINESLYGDVQTAETTDGYTLTFQSPTRPEAWLPEKETEFIFAEGTVTLTFDYQIIMSRYTVSYNDKGNTVTQTIETALCDELSPTQPLEKEYRSIPHPDIPILLENACGYILQVKAVNSVYNERILCEAFGDERTRIIDLQLLEETDFSASLKTDVTLTNTGRPGETTNMSQTESSSNGNYQLIVDGKNVQPPLSANADTLRNYCKDHLVGTIMLPQFIETVKILEQGQEITFVFTAKEELSVLIDEDICQMLYDDPSVLVGIATDVVPNVTHYTLTVDKFTGLPVRSTIEHSTIYTIADIPYTLEYYTEQSYSYPNIKTTP